MTARPGAAPEPTAGRLARLHLGTGLLRLARVELEELAGEGRLDADGVLNLAEARWRTGDLRGAAEAAAAWLDADADVPAVADADAMEGPAGRQAGGRARALAHGLIADGLTVRGRHDDAAVHVAAALDALRAGGAGPGGPTEPAATARSLAAALDALFAGIPPRAGAWPVFELGDGIAVPEGATTTGEPGARVLAPAMEPAAGDPIAAAEERFRAGDDTAAAVLLMLALRAAPGRAGDVLKRADAALAARSDAGLLLVRAEALRSLGRHEEARVAYAVADTHARSGAPAPSPPPHPGAAHPVDRPRERTGRGRRPRP